MGFNGWAETRLNWRGYGDDRRCVSLVTGENGRSGASEER